MGNRGGGDARDALIAELARDPSKEVIEALAAIGDDDAIVHLGRCAERYPALAKTVLDVLRDMESPGAGRLAGQTNGRALFQLPTLAPQRRLGLLKNDLGGQGLAHAHGEGVGQYPGLPLSSNPSSSRSRRAALSVSNAAVMRSSYCRRQRLQPSARPSPSRRL